jgi:hypothetical protein
VGQASEVSKAPKFKRRIKRLATANLAIVSPYFTEFSSEYEASVMHASILIDVIN